MMPNATWARFAAQPRPAPRRGGRPGRHADPRTRRVSPSGKSHRAPARADKRFTDPAWQENPLLHRIMQAYLAGAETAEGLLADAAAGLA